MNLNFIKLDINILNDAKIKIIRKYPDGDSLLVLWIGLLCMAMRSDTSGYIYITHGIPYTIDDLANELDIEKKTVGMGLRIFEEYKMINRIRGGVIEIINFNKHQQLDKIERSKISSRESSKRFREKQKQLLISDGHVLVSDDTDTDTDTDIELETDKEIDTDKKEHEKIVYTFYKKYTEKTCQFLSPHENDFSKAFKYIEKSENKDADVKNIIDAIPDYFTKPYWFNSKNKACKVIDPSTWSFGSFIVNVHKIIAGKNKNKGSPDYSNLADMSDKVSDLI